MNHRWRNSKQPSMLPTKSPRLALQSRILGSRSDPQWFSHCGGTRHFMTRLTETHDGATRQALKYVAWAALLFSSVPLAIDKLGSSRVPFVVGAGITVGYAIFTEVARRISSSQHQVTYNDILRRCRSDAVSGTNIILLLGIAALNAFDFLFLAWSTSFIDTAASSSLYELWPLTWFLTMQYVDRRRHHSKISSRVSLMTVSLMLLGTGALALIVYSVRTPNAVDSAPAIPMFGILLALMAPVLGGLAALNFLLADRILYGRGSSTDDGWTLLSDRSISSERAEETIAHAAQAISHALAAPVALLLAVTKGGFPSLSWTSAFIGGVLCGALLSGPGGALIRRSHIISSHREIITLQYIAPILALGWLALFTEISVGRLDFLIFGTVTIVAINMLINVDPEMPDGEQMSGPEESTLSTPSNADPVPIQARYSLKALVLCLLGFGMFIYFRDELLPGEEFGWADGDYWAVLSLAATIFALLLAFRLTRVEGLVLNEDHRTFGLIRRIEMLPSEMFTSPTHSNTKEELLRNVRGLNRAHRLSEYQIAYENAHSILSSLARSVFEHDIAHSYDERREIAEIRTEVDALAHGRQHAREFTERIALWMMGGIIVALCLAVPPQHLGWARLLAETFSMLLASVVVFLLFHLADMRRSRGDELLMSHEQDGSSLRDGLHVRFRADKDYTWQRIFAGLIIVGIVSTVVGLLAWNRLASV